LLQILTIAPIIPESAILATGKHHTTDFKKRTLKFCKIEKLVKKTLDMGLKMTIILYVD